LLFLLQKYLQAILHFDHFKQDSSVVQTSKDTQQQLNWKKEEKQVHYQQFFQ